MYGAFLLNSTMPNYTVADARKHNKSLTDKQAKQWISVANSAYARCVKEKKGNCDGYSIRVANGVVKKHSESEIDVLLRFLGDNEVREQVLDGLDHQYCSELFENTVVETVVIEGTEVAFLDKESYLAPISEVAFAVSEAEAEDAAIDTDTGVTEGRHLAVFRALQGKNREFSGISKNRNFYSGEVAEALAPLLAARKKMYLNHKPQDKMGRPVEDLAGVINESWAKEGASYVKTDVLTENPASGWIWEVIKKYPDQIGVSINAFVKGRRAVIDKIPVFAVEGWGFLNSLDFVGDPSAGGTLQSTESADPEETATIESEVVEMLPVAQGISAITEAFKTSLSAELNKQQRYNAISQIGWLVTDLIRQAARDKESDEAARQKNVDALLKEFSVEIKKIDPVSLYADDKHYWDYESVDALCVSIDLLTLQMNEAIVEPVSAVLEAVSFDAAVLEVSLNHVVFSEKSWSDVDVSKLPPSAFFIIGEGTKHLPYRDEEGHVNKEALHAIESVLSSNGSKLSIPRLVKQKLQRLLKAAGPATVTTLKEEIMDPEEVKKLTWEQLVLANPNVVIKQSEFDAALKAAVEATNELTAKLKVAEEKAQAALKELDERKLKDAINEQTQMVDRLLGESKILDASDAAIVSPTFRETLLREAATGGEAKVKVAIEDREALITAERAKKGPVVVGNGQKPAPVVEAAPTNGFPVVVSESREELVRNLTASR